MIKTFKIFTAVLVLILTSCGTDNVEEETNECIKALEAKGHSHQEAKDMCEAGEVLETVK